MLKLKDFQDFQVRNSSKLKGGAPEPTPGGRKQIFLGNSFNYGRDIKDEATGVTAFCDITNSTYGPDTIGGPQCI